VLPDSQEEMAKQNREQNPCPRCGYPDRLKIRDGSPESFHSEFLGDQVDYDVTIKRSRLPGGLAHADYRLSVHHSGGGYRLIVAATGDFSFVIDPDPELKEKPRGRLLVMA
jgi:hypothetical protein